MKFVTLALAALAARMLAGPARGQVGWPVVIANWPDTDGVKS